MLLVLLKRNPPVSARAQVVNTSSEPDLSRSLAQLRSRLGGCWLSSAQAATVASVVPRVVAGVSLFLLFLFRATNVGYVRP